MKKKQKKRTSIPLTRRTLDLCVLRMCNKFLGRRWLLEKSLSRVGATHHPAHCTHGGLLRRRERESESVCEREGSKNLASVDILK